MREISENYEDATIETIGLIQRLLKYLDELGERKQLFNFLSQIEAKANKRKNSSLAQQSRKSHLLGEQEPNLSNYWKGVRDTIKMAKAQLLKNDLDFSQYLSNLKKDINISSFPERVEKTNISPITGRILSDDAITSLNAWIQMQKFILGWESVLGIYWCLFITNFLSQNYFETIHLQFLVIIVLVGLFVFTRETLKLLIIPGIILIMINFQAINPLNILLGLIMAIFSFSFALLRFYRLREKKEVVRGIILRESSSKQDN